MASGLTTKFLNASDSSYTTLLLPINASVTTIEASGLSAYSIGDKVLLTFDRIDANGDPVPGNKIEKIYGEVTTGNILINCIRGLDGTTPQPHSSGAIIEDLMTSTHMEALREGLLLEHTETGAHAPGFVQQSHLSAGAISYIQTLFQGAYPIGSIYTNATNATNPATLLGFGTWAAITDRVLVGKAASGTFATAGATGGAETVAISETQMPAHYHSGTTAGDGNHTHSINREYGSNTGLVPPGQFQQMSTTNNSGGTTNTAGWHAHSFNTDWRGSGAAHNNLQPYVVVYMWQRTA